MTGKRGVMGPDTTQRVIEAARLRAKGASWEAIGKVMGLTENSVKNWSKRWPQLWESSYLAAMEQVCNEVRQIAGTPQMLAAFNTFIDAAESAERWARKIGKPLFAQPSPAVISEDGGNHTLRTFFELYYLKTCLVQASEETVYLYRKQLSKWELLTGNPPLKAITNETLTDFRQALMAQRSKWKHRRPLSLWTVRGHLQTVQTLCDKAGPPRPRNRDAAGFIGHSPWCKPPKAELPEPKIVSSEIISKCYEAAALMETPVIGRVKPGAWWRALLVFAYNTGLRSRAIFGLKWKDVDFKNRRITVPKEIIKSRRRVVLPMNDIVVAHLRTIQGARELVFERPWTKEAFRMAFYKLQNLAEVPKAQRFQLHRLRKTCATELFRLDPGAAQLMMGHRNIGMTIDHYTNAPAALTNAVESMPQPAAFTASA